MLTVVRPWKWCLCGQGLAASLRVHHVMFMPEAIKLARSTNCRFVRTPGWMESTLYAAMTQHTASN